MANRQIAQYFPLALKTTELEVRIALDVVGFSINQFGSSPTPRCVYNKHRLINYF